jgi:hypothetical protein
VLYNLAWKPGSKVFSKITCQMSKHCLMFDCAQTHGCKKTLKFVPLQGKQRQADTGKQSKPTQTTFKGK